MQAGRQAGRLGDVLPKVYISLWQTNSIIQRFKSFAVSVRIFQHFCLLLIWKDEIWEIISHMHTNENVACLPFSTFNLNAFCVCAIYTCILFFICFCWVFAQFLLLVLPLTKTVDFIKWPLCSNASDVFLLLRFIPFSNGFFYSADNSCFLFYFVFCKSKWKITYFTAVQSDFVNVSALENNR